MKQAAKIMSLLLALIISTITLSTPLSIEATLLPIDTVYASIDIDGIYESAPGITLGEIADNMIFTGYSASGTETLNKEYYSIKQGDTVPVNKNAKVFFASGGNHINGKEYDNYREADFSEIIYPDYLFKYDSYPLELNIIVGSGKPLDPGNTRYIITVDVKYALEYETKFYMLENGKKEYLTIKDESRYDLYHTGPERYYLCEELLSYDDEVYVEIDNIHLINKKTGERVNSAECSVIYKDNGLMSKESQNVFTNAVNRSAVVSFSGTLDGKTIFSDYNLEIECYGEYFIPDVCLFLNTKKDVNIADSISINDAINSERPYITSLYNRAERSMSISVTYDLRGKYPPESEFAVKLLGLKNEGGSIYYNIEQNLISYTGSTNRASDAAALEFDSSGRGELNYLLTYKDIETSGEFKVNVLITVLKNAFEQPQNEYAGFFDVTGIKSYNNVQLNIYKTENKPELPIDGYTDNGYITIFIDDKNDIETDISRIILDVKKADNVKVYNAVTGEPVSDFSSEPQDFSGGTIEYTISDGKRTLNYFVTVLKRESGGKLYVNGPAVREIYFSDAAGIENRRHDVLIANTGGKVLQDLKAELIDPVNIAIDNYYQVGGSENNTLEAFDTVSEGQMSNLAKVRLAYVKDGPVSGTLKVSAKDQESVYIELTGYAGALNIVTNSNLKNGVKYVPYSSIIATDLVKGNGEILYKLGSGELPEGLALNSSTGEIYGVSKNAGTYSFSILAYYGKNNSVSSKDFTLEILENTNENVYMSIDEDYALIEPIGIELSAVTHEYCLYDVSKDQLFISNGGYDNFIDLWLNGEKLIRNTEYTAEPGSTRITVKSQVFQNLPIDSTNTIAAEFRVDKNYSKELKVTAQNFKIRSDAINQPGLNTNTSTTATSAAETVIGDNSNSENSNAVNIPITSYTPAAETAADQQFIESTGNNNSAEIIPVMGYTPAPAQNIIGNTGENISLNADENTAGSGSALIPVSAGNNNYNSGPDDFVNSFAGITINGTVFDSYGNSASGLSVEIHSDVKTAYTDKNGRFTVNNVEFGNHTVIMKNENTGEYAEKTFLIEQSKSQSISSGGIYAPDGAAVSLNIIFDGNNIEFMTGNKSKNEANANTGAEMPSAAAIIVLGVTITAISAYFRKR